jgi:hypothetical protein
MQQQKKALQVENDELKEKLEKHGYISEGIDEKKKYMEGAVWMGKKLSNEVEKVCQSYEFLLLEYNQRIGAGQNFTSTERSANEHEANRKYLNYESASHWLIEAVKQAGFDLYEKTITILESSMYHMEDAGQGKQEGLSQSEQQPGHFPEIDMLLLENIHTNQ